MKIIGNIIGAIFVLVAVVLFVALVWAMIKDLNDD